jgi:hypothetical protein
MENNIDLDNIHFNHLFAKASEDELVISFQEIESQILNAPLKHKPLKFSRAHILFISLPFILFVLFILYNTDKSPRTHTNSLTSVTSVNKDTVQNTDQISLPIARKIQANFHPKQKPIVVKNIRFEPTPKVQENVEQVIAPFYPQELPSGELILSYEELAKLHIYTDGCELKYTNLRDSLYTNRSVLRKRQSRIHYYTEIQSSGGSYTMNNSVLASDSMMRVLSDSFLPAYPMFIEKEITFLEKKSTTLNVGDVTTDMLELKSPLTVAQDYVYEAKKLLVPIRVELKAKANMYGRTDYDLIFWFKQNK